ncbi:MAG: cation:proton antiporter [Planctomycetes bacterium]|nr:cation:proton antiporter [Planctomycetota bacterium]
MHNIDLIVTIATGLAVALAFGLLTHRLGLSPILGYLLAGVALGPHTPGFIADSHLAAQLAEIGVILMMFGVGMHFHWKDLLAVKGVALPGAIGQSAVATVLGCAVGLAFGMPLGAGIVMGLAISVASTVVLLRVLADNHVLLTGAGRIAVGWLVVEDLFTVLILVLLPAFAGAAGATGEEMSAAGALGWALVRLTALTLLVLLGGGLAIPWFLERIARLRSGELFTLAVLALALGIATASAVFFGASMALGAFLAGMVVSQSKVHHQAAADALPMRDAFAVLFFVSVGMLFDPRFLWENPGMVAAMLAVILIGKSAAALLIVLVLGHPVKTALTAAVSLAQIGEFSFIVGELGHALGLVPDEGRSLLVACALISITLNPVLFRRIGGVERFLRARPALWRVLNLRNRNEQAAASGIRPAVELGTVGAIVIGYGPVGRTLTRILTDFGIRPTVVDLNVDTVRKLNDSGLAAVYGDASRSEILKAAGVQDASYLLVTLPDLTGRVPVLAAARAINPKIRVFVRAHYLGERAMLDEFGATIVAYEEAEVAVSLAQSLLHEVGASEDAIRQNLARIREELAAPAPRSAPAASNGAPPPAPA